MTIPEEDLIPLGHMLEACDWVLSVVAGRAQQELDQDLLLFLALAKAVETVGEAANRVSDDTQSIAQEIPWRRIIGMRNRLVHNYDDIDLGTLWLAAQEHTPNLIADLRRILPDDFVPTPIR